MSAYCPVLSRPVRVLGRGGTSVERPGATGKFNKQSTTAKSEIRDRMLIQTAKMETPAEMSGELSVDSEAAGACHAPPMDQPPDPGLLATERSS